MIVLKRILAYFFWTLISLLSGFCYMRILLGAKPASSEGFFDFFFNLMYEYAFFHIGAMVGLSIAFVFISIDISYLHKKLENVRYSALIRLLIIILITIILGTTHYIFEKVI